MVSYSRVLQGDLDFYAFFMLLIILFSSYNKAEGKFINYKIFMLLTTTTMMTLFFEGISWIVDGKVESYWIELNIFINVVFFALNPIPPIFWICYAEYQINENVKRLKKTIIVLSVIASLHAILSIVSPYYKLLFFIDEKNMYHRGPNIVITISLFYIFFSYALFLIIKNRKRIGSRNFRTLLMFQVPIVIGGFLQLFFYGLPLLWTGMSLSILLIYINIQKNEMNTDFLTGVYNRRQFEKKLRIKISESLNKDKMFSLLILDLDEFKEINDTYGHNEGDIALETAAIILHDSLRDNDFIARYAGDEFAVILDTGNKSVLEEIVSRIKNNVKYHNQNSMTDYDLSFSIGYDIYDNAKNMNLEEYFMYIDKLMYDEKKKKKQSR